jgi:glycosyltransferase involved in cell wall biosynthesis
VSTDRWYRRHLHISEYSRWVAGHNDKPWARVISGGVDTEKFTERGAPSPAGCVLFVGRLLPHKGVHDLIAGMPDGVPLELIGQPYDASYYTHLQSLAAGRAVTFRHNVDDAALVQAYQRSMCVVLPSVYDSGFQPPFKVPELLGQTLLEGMSCGLPAICTDVASMPEVVVNRETGWVVPPNQPDALGDRIRWLREHPTQAAAMGRAGRRRVERQFTWEAVVERCLDAYRD